MPVSYWEIGINMFCNGVYLANVVQARMALEPADSEYSGALYTDIAQAYEAQYVTAMQVLLPPFLTFTHISLRRWAATGLPQGLPGYVYPLDVAGTAPVSNIPGQGVAAVFKKNLGGGEFLHEDGKLPVSGRLFLGPIGEIEVDNSLYINPAVLVSPEWDAMRTAVRSPLTTPEFDLELQQVVLNLHHVKPSPVTVRAWREVLTCTTNAQATYLNRRLH